MSLIWWVLEQKLSEMALTIEKEAQEFVSETGLSLIAISKSRLVAVSVAVSVVVGIGGVRYTVGRVRWQFVCRRIGDGVGDREVQKDGVRKV